MNLLHEIVNDERDVQQLKKAFPNDCAFLAEFLYHVLALVEHDEAAMKPFIELERVKQYIETIESRLA